MRTRRLPIVAVIALALLALAGADFLRSDDDGASRTEDRTLMPLASPTGAVSSAFFCAGGAATPATPWNATLVVANPNPDPATILVTSYPGALASDANGTAAVAALQPKTVQVAVGARSRAEVKYSDIQVSPFAAVVAETSDPDIAVERRISSAGGSTTSTAPCASASSDVWYLPTGTTTRDARELIAVFNPFPVDAVVDVTFQTNDGFRNPAELEALPVPGGRVRVLDISAAVPRLEQLAATVTARSGRVIADRMQSFDGSDPNHPAGLAVTLGAPATSQVWAFGEGEITDGLNENYTLFNPSDESVDAEVDITLADPATNGEVDPLALPVPPHSYALLVMRDQTRVLPNVPHSVTVRTQDEAGLVVERVISGSAPSPRRGYGPALGSPLLATNWVFADGRAVAGQASEVLTVVNLSTETTARVRFSALAQGQSLALDGLQDVEVPAGARVAIDLGQHIDRADLPVVVESDRPIAVERGFSGKDGNGISYAFGVPLPASTVLPPLRRPGE